MKNLVSLKKGERGASMVEYALLLGLIAIVALVAVQSTGEKTWGTHFTSACAMSSEIRENAASLGWTCESLADACIAGDAIPACDVWLSSF